MRQDIYQMWSIQESLLQQYRGLAITLMGLIAAGILVAMSRLSDGWDQLSGLLPAILAGEATLRALADLAIFAMMVTLLVLGIRAGIFFRKITGQRARFVTFYQNLLLAEENGQLQAIASRHGLAYPLDLLGALRRLSNTRFTPLSFERHLDSAAFTAFQNEILQTDAANARPEVRHNVARRFLSESIFSVFNWFFFFSAIHALIIMLHML